MSTAHLYVEHKFEQNPENFLCLTCRKPAKYHRIRERIPKQVYHLIQGNPCQYVHKKTGKVCGLGPEAHRMEDYLYVGVDGEGITEGLERFHKYALLSAVSEDGCTINASIENIDRGLGTEECLNFLVNLYKPAHGGRRVFGYSLNYDWTKILEDIDDKTLYLLFRPELRPRKTNPERGPRPVYWRGFSLNMVGTKFTITKRCEDLECCNRRFLARMQAQALGISPVFNSDHPFFKQKIFHDCRHKKRIVVWDLFRFFQSKFVVALEKWKVGNKDLWDRMRKMKDARPTFNPTDWYAIKQYCAEECQFMAKLAHKLVDAHFEAGLTLTKFYGAGSSGGAILQKMGIKEKIRRDWDFKNVDHKKLFEDAQARAFFGGWFEISWVGELLVEKYGPVVNWDISSAYPYQTTFLPCLLHAQWEYTKSRKALEGVRTALVHYELGNVPKSHRKYDNCQAWGPFPYRDSSGTISHPLTSGGGWIWLDEYLAGEKHWPHVHFVEAFIYNSDCECQPFEMMPHFYRERLKLGKEGAGIVLKLGPNSVYGKLAQSIGFAIFASWIWSAIITSGTRAQMLDVIGLHKNWWDVLMIATDGLFTLDQSVLPPLPKDTQTWECPDDKGAMVKKPLGGWEKKLITKGLFCARPGVYFPLNPTIEEIDSVRARGVGKAIVLEQWKTIVNHYREHGLSKVVKLKSVPRFCGAKTSIHKVPSLKDDWRAYERALGETVKPHAFHPMKEVCYGQWITREQAISFDPEPKREGIVEGDEKSDAKRLLMRNIPRVFGLSRPYRAAIKSQERRALELAAQILEEQPDHDFAEWTEESHDE